jgi:hypothetical protein
MKALPDFRKKLKAVATIVLEPKPGRNGRLAADQRNTGYALLRLDEHGHPPGRVEIRNRYRQLINNNRFMNCEAAEAQASSYLFESTKIVPLTCALVWPSQLSSAVSVSSDIPCVLQRRYYTHPKQPFLCERLSGLSTPLQHSASCWWVCLYRLHTG